MTDAGAGATRPLIAFSDWSRAAVLRRSLQLLFLMSFLLLPFHELVYHFVFKGHPIDGSEILYPEQLLLLALAFTFRGPMASAVAAWRVEIWLVAINALAFWVSVWTNDADAQYAIQVFVVGSVLPLFFLLMLSAATERFGFEPVRDGLPYLMVGVAVVCAVGLLAYPASFGIPRDFHEFIYDFRTDRAAFGSQYGFWYGDLTFGNFNVFASCLLPALLLGYGWFRVQASRKAVTTILWSGWCLLVLANLYVCYSRGSILVLNACAAFFGLLSLRRPELRRGLVTAAVVVIVFDLLVVAPRGAIPYWRSLGEKSQSNSAFQRIEQWEDVAEGRFRRAPLAHGGSARRKAPRPVAYGRMHHLLFGVGIGNYGVSRGLGVDANTHNLFLNQYVVGGLPGFLSFGVLYGLVVLRGLRTFRRRRDRLGHLRLAAVSGLVAIGLIGVLSQFEFANLGTMTGGLLFWTCAFFSRLGFREDAA